MDDRPEGLSLAWLINVGWARIGELGEMLRLFLVIGIVPTGVAETSQASTFENSVVAYPYSASTVTGRQAEGNGVDIC